MLLLVFLIICLKNPATAATPALWFKIIHMPQCSFLFNNFADCIFNIYYVTK